MQSSSFNLCEEEKNTLSQFSQPSTRVPLTIVYRGLSTYPIIFTFNTKLTWHFRLRRCWSLLILRWQWCGLVDGFRSRLRIHWLFRSTHEAPVQWHRRTFSLPSMMLCQRSNQLLEKLRAANPVRCVLRTGSCAARTHKYPRYIRKIIKSFT